MSFSFNLNANSTHLLIRTHEITTKGRNRQDFEKRLERNIKRIIPKNFTPVWISGRLLIEFKLNPDTIDFTPIVTKLSNLGGVTAIAPCCLSENNTEEIESKSILWAESALKNKKNTFAVRTRRVNKDFHLSSTELDLRIGSKIRQIHPNLKTDLKKPEFKLNIEVRQKKTIIYSDELAGSLGLPQDSTQLVLCLLSGGIDSPVAAFEIMRRGCTPILLHFHSKPYTSESSIQKVIKLAKILRQSSSYPIELWLVSLYEIQKNISEVCNERYRTVHYRRFMMKIAEELAQKRNALALATGDALGQVASQTLQNLSQIEKGVNLPVLRPLITLDKNEIISKAKKIGTYETSILPHDDSCVLFASKSPTTKAAPHVINDDDSRLNSYELIFRALDSAEKIII